MYPKMNPDTPKQIVASADDRVTKNFLCAAGKHTYSHWVTKGPLEVVASSVFNIK